MPFIKKFTLLVGVCSAALATESSGSSFPVTITTSSTPQGTGLTMALTTTFNPPTQCLTDIFSAVAATPGFIFADAIEPGMMGGFSTCLPRQFYSSVLVEASGTPLPPFNPLICPSRWESFNLNSTYVVCCPPFFGLNMQVDPNPNRPGEGALCTSTVWPGVVMDITIFDATGGSTLAPTAAPDSGTIVWASAFDGVAATPFSQLATSTMIFSTMSSAPSSSKSVVSTSAPVPPTSASQTTSSASPSATSTAFLPIGCWTDLDTNSRALTGPSYVNYTSMTIEICQTYCAAYTYFGIEYGGECYCGNTFTGSSTQAASSDCNMSCGGNSAESCGAGNRLDVYSKGGVPPIYPSIVRSVGNYAYRGCYTDSQTNRTLTGAYNRDSAMTVELCESLCSPTYTLFGLEYAIECFCGSSMTGTSTSVADSECASACAGNDLELCGASNRLSLYGLGG